MAAATRVLSSELSKLARSPIPGFLVEPSCDDLFVWNVGIFGPPNTLYEGAYLRVGEISTPCKSADGSVQAKLTFPKTYPMDPPTLIFTHELWHPNVFAVMSQTDSCCLAVRMFLHASFLTHILSHSYLPRVTSELERT
jgi:ubiquitin-protein ligase